MLDVAPDADEFEKEDGDYEDDEGDEEVIEEDDDVEIETVDSEEFEVTMSITCPRVTMDTTTQEGPGASSDATKSDIKISEVMNDLIFQSVWCDSPFIVSCSTVLYMALVLC